jgi:hypothetical protein
MKNIFRLFAIIAFVAIIGFSFIACGGDDPDPKPDPNPPPTTATVSVTGVSMEKTATTILVGSTETLYATVLPDNATNKSVTWSTSNAAVATVSNGTVHAVSAGTATITVKTADGGKTATCNVTVSATAVAVTGVSLNKSSTTLTVGGTETLTPSFTPSGATNQNVTWNSSNTAVATVSNGTVHAVSAGTATITVTAADTTNGTKTATCAVTVTAGTTPITTYTVIYNANGGTGTTASSDHTIGTSKALTANGFTRSGYLFVCWTINEGGTGTRYYNGQSVTDLTTTATTVNLYAQWAEGNMYYGVTSTAALNALKGTGGSLNVFNTALANPTDNSKVYITTITNPTTPSSGKEITFSGNNYWFVLVPKSLGAATIRDVGNVDVTNSTAKDSASLNGIEYWLHASTSSGSRDGLTLKIGY